MSTFTSVAESATSAPRARPAALAGSLHNALVYGICLLLSFGPLAFGATEWWSVAALEAGAAVLVALWMGKQLVLGRVKVRVNPLYRPMALLAVLVAVQLITGMTAYRSVTLSRAGLFLAYAAVLFVVSHTLRSDSDLRRFCTWFSVFGLAVALFAIIQGFTDPSGKLYWVRMPRDLGWTYGPYVDHSHYAGLMVMLLPVPLALAVLGVEHGPKRALYWLSAGTIATSIFLSQSRGGVLAMLVELGFLAALTVPKAGLRRHHRRNFTLAAAAAIFLAFVGWAGGESLLQRFSVPRPHDLIQEGRTVILQDSLHMIARKPLAGFGLGTYPLIFPQFRSFYSSIFVNHAHNDYVEFVAETGTVGAIAIGWFLFALYRAGLRKTASQQSRIIDATTLAALTSCTAIVAHSFWDFNLQIPANAALFFAFCGLASTQITAPRLREQSANDSRD